MSENIYDRIEDAKKKLDVDSELFFEDVEFADGTIQKQDTRWFFDIVDALASNYGLGGCKNISEYIRSIDEADQDDVYLLIEAIIRRNQQISGKSPQQSTSQSPSTPSSSRHRHPKGKSKPPRRQVMPQSSSKEPVSVINFSGGSGDANTHHMARFLKSWGADYGQVNKAVQDIKHGNVRVSNVDLSWITSEALKHPDFPLDLAFEAIRESMKGTTNFNVDYATLNKRLKEGK